jgi:hypothetical protein
MYRLSATVRLRTIEGDGSHWAFDVGNGSHYELNETAQIVLRGVEAQRTPNQIAVELTAEYGIPARQAESDVYEALEAFARDGLIDVISPAEDNK